MEVVTAQEFKHELELMPTSEVKTIGMTMEEGKSFAETMAAVLWEIVDPDFRDPDGAYFRILELGLVRKIVATQGSGIEIDMVLTTPTCPSAALLLQSVHQLAENVAQEFGDFPKINVNLRSERYQGQFASGEAREFLDWFCADSPTRFKEIFGRSTVDG